MSANALEDMVGQANQWYAKQNVARIDKLHPPTIQRGKIRVLIGKSTVDFCGVWNGKFVAFDAKMSKLDHMQMKNLHFHQLKYLVDVNRMGGFGFLLIQVKQEGKDRYWVVPIIKEWADVFWATRKSMKVVDLDKYGFEVTFGKGKPILDYLKGVEAWIGKS